VRRTQSEDEQRQYDIGVDGTGDRMADAFVYELCVERSRYRRYVREYRRDDERVGRYGCCGQKERREGQDLGEAMLKTECQPVFF
jgi:hypothetical protein